MSEERARSVAVSCGGSVATLRRLSGGASAESWLIDGSEGELWVVRLIRGGEAGMSIGARAEAEVQRVARAHGVPVPDIVGVVDDGYLMEALVGETLPKRLLNDPAYAAARSRLTIDAAVALAKIHAVPATEVESLPILDATTQLDLLEALHRSIGQAVPTFEWALRWLRSHTIAVSDPALVHGDFRIGNLMVNEGGLRAVLDWELAHRGDRWEDLGWLCAPAWRFGGSGEAGGFATREAFFAAYADAAGIEVDVERVRYWEVLATLKWGVICQFQASRFLEGRGSVELAAIGRRVTETELDLLLLLDAA